MKHDLDYAFCVMLVHTALILLFKHLFCNEKIVLLRTLLTVF